MGILHHTCELLSKSPLHWGREGLFTSVDAANGQWSVVWIIWIHLEDCIHDLRDKVRATKIPFLVVEKKCVFFTWHFYLENPFFWPPKPLFANLRDILVGIMFCNFFCLRKKSGAPPKTFTEGYNSMNRAWWNCYLPQYAAERRCFSFLFVEIVPVGWIVFIIHCMMV